MRLFTHLSVAGFMLLAGISQGQEMRIDARVEVRDPEGQPVDRASVLLGARHYGPKTRDEQRRADTDAKGIAELTVMAQSNYTVTVKKPGYYPTGLGRLLYTEKDAVGVQVVPVELRPVRNPVAGITKVVYRVPLPAIDKPVGYDLLAGDWVAPFGQGSVSDLIFTVSGYLRGARDYDLRLALAFSGEGDGVQVFKAAPNSGSVFKFPYLAPLTGYQASRFWRKSFDGKTRHSDADLSRETNYIFRVRSERNDKGEVVRALYGVIVNEVEVFANNASQFNVTFCYRLNPDYTRNLEFDPPEIATR